MHICTDVSVKYVIDSSRQLFPVCRSWRAHSSSLCLKKNRNPQPWEQHSEVVLCSELNAKTSVLRCSQYEVQHADGGPTCLHRLMGVTARINSHQTNSLFPKRDSLIIHVNMCHLFPNLVQIHPMDFKTYL